MRVWVHRLAIGLSVDELKDTARLFRREEVAVKLSYHSLSVMVSNEIHTAMRRSGVRTVADTETVAHEVLAELPESARSRVFAKVLSLKQFGSWIGLEVEYDGFDEERAVIEAQLSKVLQIEHQWHAKPHISLARGMLSRVKNVDEITDSLPSVVELGLVAVAKKKN